MRTITLFTILALCGGVVLAEDEEPQFTTEFHLDACKFKSSGTNPYFNLRPGRSVLEAEEDGELERVVITVKNEFQGIFVPGLGVVRTRVIEERESVDDELVEVSRNFFAICSETNDVVYFGEEVDIYHADGSITHDGAWLAGNPDADGLAEPGVIMPGRFLLGSRYYQEIADGIALDRAEHVEDGLSYETEAGEFDDCVRIIETSPLEPGHQSEKIYCRGVGLVADNDAELVASTYIEDDDD
jgi:hypothetical protein